MRTNKLNASSPSLGTCYCSVKSQPSFWFLPSLSRSKSDSDPPWSPQKPQWVWPHPWAPWNTLHLGASFRGVGRAPLWGKECSVVSQDKSSAERCSRQRVSAQHRGLCKHEALEELCGMCVGGRGQRRRLVQVLLIGEGFMIFTTCLVPCVCSETQTKEGKGEFICF